MNPYALLSLFITLFNLAIGTYILASGPADTIKRRFFFLTIPLTLWPLTEFLLRITSDAVTAMIFSKASWGFAIFIPFTLVLFILVFPRKRAEISRNWLITAIFFTLSTLFFILTLSTNTIIQTVTMKPWGYAALPAGPLYILYAIYFTGTLSGIIAVLVHSFFKSSRRLDQIQIAIAIIAITVPTVIGSISQLFYSLFKIDFIPLATPSTIISTAMIAIAVIRYKFIVITPTAAADAILEAIPDSLILLDTDSKIVMVNEATCEMFEKPEEELLGSHFLDLIYLDYKFDSSLDDLLIRMNTIKIYGIEIFYVVPGGKLIPMVFSSSPIKNDSGSTSGIACIAKNMTALKKVIKNLEQTHDQLWNEMELAKQIQTSILPPSPFVPGYKTAAIMSPASEVGGDFYEITTIKGVTWIAIGDVSGHGVTPGLIMMMVQSAMQSAITLDPGITPQNLFITMNSVLRTNIARLHEDKYMTLSILRLEKDGSLTMVGKHQDILIYRTGQNKLDRIKSEGVWIGMADNIDNFSPEQTLTLNSGDVMLLYTDGLTEARNSSGEMFEDQLPQQFLRFANEVPDVITKSLLKTCTRHMEVQDDDISMIVLKKE